ncbi:MAG: 2-iminobutanoate/2-iminopropanoate deaminase [Candidatus Promineifilaceae bacterium]|jgi:2-iminobutanoate/2-iminopropanoate deaminase
MNIISTDTAPAAIGPYAQAITSGNIVYCSGQLPVNPASGDVVEGGIVEQTRQVFLNLAAVLAAANSSMAQVVKTTVFLADMNDFVAMNGEYAAAMGEHTPARATVEVSRLPKDVRVEIECIAELG